MEEFPKTIAQKRVGKSKNSIIEKGAMTVQRLSSEVSGKAQKYARMGAREFVPYDFDELTLDYIKEACKQHFETDEEMLCDVLVGEQGPSCASLEQLPDTMVIFVRFIDSDMASDENVHNKPKAAVTKEPGVKKRRIDTTMKLNITPNKPLHTFLEGNFTGHHVTPQNSSNILHHCISTE